MIHHYLTKYKNECDIEVYESWLQLDLFKWSFTFSKLRYEDGKRVQKKL